MSPMRTNESKRGYLYCYNHSTNSYNTTVTNNNNSSSSSSSSAPSPIICTQTFHLIPSILSPPAQLPPCRSPASLLIYNYIMFLTMASTTPAPPSPQARAGDVEQPSQLRPPTAPITMPGDVHGSTNSSHWHTCHDEDGSTKPYHCHWHAAAAAAAAAVDAESGHGGGSFSSKGFLDPRAKWVREWNRVFLLGCAAGLVFDPLFFYALSVSRTCMCLFVDGWFAITVTALRCMTDALHVWNMWLHLKSACCPPWRPRSGDQGGAGADDDNGKAARYGRRGPVALYLRSMRGFFFDLFVILPIPQVVLWVAAPAMIRRGSTTTVMTVFLVTFLLQYLPKIYHSIRLLRRTQNLSGYIFGTIWWGIALNMIAYFVAAHAAGACWYLLGVQRAAKCLKEQCLETKGCGVAALGCEGAVYYGSPSSSTLAVISVDDAEKKIIKMAWGSNGHARAACLDSSDNYDYGAYKWTVPLVTNPSRLEKILLPIFWGLMTLSTFGNLESTTEWLEVVFNIIVIMGGLILVTMLIGNIKVFLNATTSKKQGMHLKMRNIEWWMRRRHLPQSFRQRVRQYERQRWAAMRGVDECQMIHNLPGGLRRDIKYHLCLDLVRQVPLFQHMDAVVLENICDRVKSLIFPKGEMISREGDPVERMLFVVRGHLQSSQVLRDGVKSCCTLGPGNFTGDELLSWCLRRPFIERLPMSSSTLVTLETTEAFGLEASDVKYVTQHFRYTFVNDKVKRSARYYSPGWRTWAAVAIQLAWRRYRHRLTLSSLSFIRPRRPLSRSSSMGEDKLRLYTAMLTSPKPNQDDFSF